MTQDLYNELSTFRETHPVKTVTYQKKPYRYLAGGESGPTVFLLPGGLGIGEPFFLHVLDLEPDCRVIAPSYPDVSSLEDLAAGMHHIAQAEGADRYSLVGQSAGGLVAQVMVRRFPEQVDKVMLSHTSTVTTDTDEAEIAERVAGMNKRLRMLRLIPFFVVKRQLMNSIDHIVETMRPDELYFWKGYFEYVFEQRTKRDQMAMMRTLIDFASNYRFSLHDLDDWPGEIMILDSDADASIPDAERKQVRRLYPRAQLHTLEDAGHLAIVSERETYLRLMRGFLKL